MSEMSQQLLALANLLRPERKLAEMVCVHIKKTYGCSNLVAFNEEGSVEGLSADDKDKLYLEWAEKVKAKDFDYFTEAKAEAPAPKEKEAPKEPAPQPVEEKLVKEVKESEGVREVKFTKKPAAKKPAAKESPAPAVGSIDAAIKAMVDQAVDAKLSSQEDTPAPAPVTDEELESRIRKILSKIMAGG